MADLLQREAADDFTTAPPVALTLAGSDCSAGAGLQADLKTFSALGVYGLTVVTSIVAETPATVAAVLPLPARLVAQQYDLLLRSYPLAALKTGLLGSPEVIHELAARLASFPGPVVIDPVAISSSGQALVPPGYQEALCTLANTAATLLTPNRGEAEALLQSAIASPSAARDAALRLSERFGCAVLLKGGHFEGDASTDWLAHPDGVHAVTRPRLPGKTSLHGTGCTLSAAITAHLARGASLPQSVEAARNFLHRAWEHPLQWEAPDHSCTKALAHGGARVQI